MRMFRTFFCATRYNVYADIRSGSQDLCKFSLDFMFNCFGYHIYLPIRLRRVVKCVTSGDVGSGVAEYDP